MVSITQTVTVSGTPEITLSFDTRADALLAQTGDSKFIQIGELKYAYDASGTALTTGDGRKWSPVGTATPEHYGAVGDGALDGTGTDDYAAFAAMIAAGHTLMKGRKGRRYISSAPLLLQDGQTIEDCAFVAPDTFTSSPGNAVFVCDGVDDVEVRKCAFYGRSVRNALIIWGSTNVRVRHNYMTAGAPFISTSVGVGQNSSDILIEGNTFFALLNYSVATNDCERVKIIGNQSFGGRGRIGINDGSVGCTAIGNTIIITAGDSSPGMNIKGVGNRNCSLVSNTIINGVPISTETGQEGISVGDDAVGAVVANNTVKGFRAGIRPSNDNTNTVINANSIEDCTYGILGEFGAYYQTITKNKIRNCTTGIGGTFRNSTIDDNEIQGGDYGINVTGNNYYSHFTENKVSLTQYEAIVIDGITNGKVSGNSAHDCGAASVSEGTYYAITVATCNKSILNENITSRDAGLRYAGLIEITTGKNNLLKNNIADECTPGGRIAIPADNTASDNYGDDLAFA